MAFESWSEVWQMGGHGVFVWSAYSVTLLAIAALVIVPWRRSRAEVKAQRAWRARQQGAASSHAP
jgi:heme exporter protein D